MLFDLFKAFDQIESSNQCSELLSNTSTMSVCLIITVFTERIALKSFSNKIFGNLI